MHNERCPDTASISRVAVAPGCPSASTLGRRGGCSGDASGSALGLVLTVLFLGLFVAGSAAATTFVRVADGPLADQADSIVEVVVLGASAAPDRAATDFRLRVLRDLRGAAGSHQIGDEITLRLPGGIAPGSGMQLLIYGVPELRQGQSALLFLGSERHGVRRPLHLSQGLFHVVEVEGKKVAFRDFSGAEEIVFPGLKDLGPEKARDLDSFAAWLADRAAGIARPGDYSVDHSFEALSSALGANWPQKFTLFTQAGLNLRWAGFGGVTWRSHNGGEPGLPGGGHNEVQQAINAWRNDGGSNITFSYGGQTGASNGFTDFDGVNAVLFDDPNNEVEGVFSCTTGGTLAIGGPWFATATRHSFNGRLYVTIQGGDVVMNDGLECIIDRNRTAAEVYAHELGHTLGLGHACGDDQSPGCGNPTLDDALMRAFVHSDNRGARLGTDDRSAVAFLYGSPSSPPNAPSNLGAAANGIGRVDLDWNDNSNNETSFRIERQTTSNFQEIGSVGTNNTNFSDTTVPSGSIVSYRVRASNGSGSSSYSNTVNLATPGEAPPSNLTAQALSATEVRLTWIDNGLAETGYEIQASAFGVFVPVATALGNANQVVVDGLNPSTAYDFQVRSTGGVLGSSTFSEVASATTFFGQPDPCVDSATTLCLNGGRYKVDIFWTDFDGESGAGSVVPAGSIDSGLFSFFDENNWELLVKVLDACAINGHFWVFAAATTDVEYTLVVTDTETGQPAVYTNPLGVASPAVTDTEAFATCPGSSPGNSAAPRVRTTSELSEAMQTFTSVSGGGAPTVAEADEKMTCVAGAETLCLNNGRFQVDLDWRDFENKTGPGTVVDLPVESIDSGVFWFFDENNWELLVKVLDACAINGHYWVLSAATTDVEYNLRVTDTSTGLGRQWINTLGEAAPALIEVEAFATCP